MQTTTRRFPLDSICALIGFRYIRRLDAQDCHPISIFNNLGSCGLPIRHCGDIQLDTNGRWRFRLETTLLVLVLRPYNAILLRRISHGFFGVLSEGISNACSKDMIFRSPFCKRCTEDVDKFIASSVACILLYLVSACIMFYQGAVRQLVLELEFECLE
ncbi:hypothetical protein Tco_1329445 [Tanacetum coccineum]